MLKPTHTVVTQLFRVMVLVVVCVSGHRLVDPVIGAQGWSNWQAVTVLVLGMPTLWLTHQLAMHAIGARRQRRRRQGTAYNRRG